VNVRLTWQANQKNKLSIFAEKQDRTCLHWPITEKLAPEAVAHQPLQSPGTGGKPRSGFQTPAMQYIAALPPDMTW
jgi:hypothetical protein